MSTSMLKNLAFAVFVPLSILHSQWKMVLSDPSDGYLFSNHSGDIFFASQNGILYRISSLDDSWISIDSLGQNSRSLFVDDSQNIFVGYTSEYVSYFHSVNAGRSWSLGWIQSNAYMLGTINAFTRTHDGALVASVSAITSLSHGVSQEYGDVFRSTDNGGSWTNVTNAHFNCYGMFTDRDGTLYVGSDTAYIHGRLYRSTDSGKSFQRDAFDFPLFVRCVTGDSSGALFVGTGGAGVYRYNGTWTPLNAGTVNSTIFSIAYAPSALFIGGDGLYYSTDKGDSWIQDSELTNCIIMSLLVKEPHIYAVAKGGVWKRRLDDFLVSVTRSALGVGQFALYQSYPKPFNSSTIISFALPTRSHVELSIYDVLGRQVTMLVSDQLNAGTYKHTWNPASVTSGLYFVRFRADSFMATRKLVLVK